MATWRHLRALKAADGAISFGVMALPEITAMPRLATAAPRRRAIRASCAASTRTSARVFGEVIGTHALFASLFDTLRAGQRNSANHDESLILRTSGIWLLKILLRGWARAAGGIKSLATSSGRTRRRPLRAVVVSATQKFRR